VQYVMVIGTPPFLSKKALMSIYESDKELFGILILNIAREVCGRLHSTDDILLHYLLKK
jgi:hypothetical protein